MEKPVDPGGGTNPIVKTKSFCVLSARRADPFLDIAAVSVRIAFRQANQFFFGLTLLPSGAVSTDHEEVRRMKNSKALPVHRTVIQFDRGSLIVILQYTVVVFQFEDGRQLNAMAFELNRDPHLPAGIAAGYV